MRPARRAARAVRRRGRAAPGAASRRGRGAAARRWRCGARRRTTAATSARSVGVAACDASSTPSSVSHCAPGSASVAVRTTTVPPPAATACTPGSSVSASSAPSGVRRQTWIDVGVVDRVGDEHDARRRRRSATDAHLQVGRRDRLAVDEQPAGAVAVGARDERAVGQRGAGTPATSSTQTSSRSSNSDARSRRSPGRRRSTSTRPLVARLHGGDQRRRRSSCTSARYGNASRSHSTSTTEPSRPTTCSETSALAVPAAG